MRSFFFTYIDDNTYKIVNGRYRGERTQLSVNGSIAAQATSDDGIQYFSTDVLGSVASVTDNYGGFIMKVYMQKILISSIILFLFCSLFSEDLGTVCKQKQEKILQLEQTIEENLRDTTVLNLFLEEKENWNKYMQSRINLLFPEEIDSVKMLWGSIESHEVTVEMIKLLDFRIQMLDNYLAREEGTDGEGKFKEYVEEIRRIKN